MATMYQSQQVTNQNWFNKLTEDLVVIWLKFCVLQAYEQNERQYKENLGLIQDLKKDHEEKMKKYVDNETMRDRSIPTILMTIEELEAENKKLLESNESL